MSFGCVEIDGREEDLMDGVDIGQLPAKTTKKTYASVAVKKDDRDSPGKEANRSCGSAPLWKAHFATCVPVST
jgi:hypothetical protein